MGTPVSLGPLSYTYLAAATVADDDWLVTSTAMIVGAYTLAHTTPPSAAGPRRVTVTHTTDTGADTLGVLIVVGTDIRGAVQVETITPVAASVVTGSKWFATVATATGVDWVISGGNDTIKVGFGAAVIVAQGAGTLGSVVVNTTAAGAITLADALGTIAILKSNVGERPYRYGVRYSGFLSVLLAAASDITVAYTAG